MKVVVTDGGRAKAGYRGKTGDCVCRAIAIATGRDYQDVYMALNEMALSERPSKRKRGRSSARTGVHRETIHRYMKSIGWKWVPTMQIGSGCRVHLRKSELPSGRLVVSLSRHLTAVIDGVIYDNHDPQRDGARCVYGYWHRPNGICDRQLERAGTIHEPSQSHPQRERPFFGLKKWSRSGA